jgi:hypothetical protein
MYKTLGEIRDEVIAPQRLKATLIGLCIPERHDGSSSASWH